MGKKKRSQPNVEDLLARPWCYYCERDFEDLKLLTSHQKAKHFKCDRCGRRLNTAGGLSVHMNQVHKETLDHVENALPNRQGLEVEIFGMEGIPQDILDQHRNRIIQNFYQAQEDRRIATGNPLPGQKLQNSKPKIKFETAEELLARFAEWRVKRQNAPTGGAMEGVVPTNPSPGSFDQPYQAPAQSFDQNYPAQGYPAQQPYGYPADGLPPRPASGATGLPPRPDGLPSGQGDDIDQLIRMAEAGIRPQKKADDAEDAGEKKSKKDKKGKMVYDDAEISPEERMAQFARYAFIPEASAA